MIHKMSKAFYFKRDRLVCHGYCWEILLSVKSKMLNGRKRIELIQSTDLIGALYAQLDELSTKQVFFENWTFQNRSPSKNRGFLYRRSPRMASQGSALQVGLVIHFNGSDVGAPIFKKYLFRALLIQPCRLGRLNGQVEFQQPSLVSTVDRINNTSMLFY